MAPALTSLRKPSWDQLFRVVGGPRTLVAPWRELDLERFWRVAVQSILVGALAGGVACVFLAGLEWTQWFLLERLASLQLPRPHGELHLTPAVPADEPRWWLLVMLPAGGGLLAGLLAWHFAPEARGPGGDAYIDAFHRHRGLVRARVPLVKAVASMLTIGSGGSAGREGPTVQVAAGLASTLARRLRLSERDRHILLVAGAAAGTGAMFRTPLGGALFGVEVLYRDDFETDAIVPSVLASVTAYSIVALVFGPGHIFEVAPDYFFVPAALPLYVVMGLGLGLFGVLHVKLRHGMEEHFFDPLRIPVWAKPALGGLLLGLFGLVVPQALGVGYGWLQDIFSLQEWTTKPNAYLLLFGLAAAKMLAVALTIGSGGSGGEMGPTMVVGGFVGGAFGLLFHQMFPSLVPQPEAFAVVGMGAFFGGVAHVPISSLLMTCEMAGSYDLLVPLMLVEGVTFVLLRPLSIYRAQVRGRADSPAHRRDGSIDVLESIEVGEVYARDVPLRSVPLSASKEDISAAFGRSEAPLLLVTEGDGTIVGMLGLEAIRFLWGEEDVARFAVAADLTVPYLPLRESDDLHEALRRFQRLELSALPVVDEEGELRGVLRHVDLDRAYERAVCSWISRHLADGGQEPMPDDEGGRAVSRGAP